MTGATVGIICLLALPFFVFRLVGNWALIIATLLYFLFFSLADSHFALGGMAAFMDTFVWFFYICIVCVIMGKNNRKIRLFSRRKEENGNTKINIEEDRKTHNE